jgi:hypothetical protein
MDKGNFLGRLLSPFGETAGGTAGPILSRTDVAEVLGLKTKSEQDQENRFISLTDTVEFPVDLSTLAPLPLYIFKHLCGISPQRSMPLI